MTETSSPDIVERLWTLIRHGRDQGMKMNDVEDAAREIDRLRRSSAAIFPTAPASDSKCPVCGAGNGGHAPLCSRRKPKSAQPAQCSAGTEQAKAWHIIEHEQSEFRPHTATEEAISLSNSIRNIGPEVVASTLFNYAKAQPSQGSFAGSLWAIAEWVSTHLRGVAQPPRVTGCVNQVEEAACLIWAELCPGMVMGDADLPHYEAAAKAVLALSSTQSEAGK